MKKLLLAILTISLIAIFSPITYGGGSIWNKTQTVYFSGGSRTVTAVYADLNDKTIRMESVIAKNQLGKVDDLRDIANQANKYGQKTTAAINGTFFYAYYGKPMPSCTIQTKGSFEFLSTAGSVIGFTGDNHAKIERLKVAIDGSINGNYEYPNNWAVWGFNNISASSDSIFTPAFGKTTGNHTKISVVVRNEIVTKIVKGKAEIPSDGYTIVFKNRNYSKKFSVGDKIDYKVNYAKILSSGKKGSLVWSDVRSTTGAGPTLVKGSKIIADGRLENFTDSKITTASGQRSFIGVTQKNVLVMGTVPNVTIKQLAAIVKKMGLYNAINLDGGASSGLYYKGRYLKTPGRQLSSAIVVTKLNIKPVRVKINNKELFYKYDFYTKEGVLMAPLKLVLKTTPSIISKKEDYNEKDI